MAAGQWDERCSMFVRVITSIILLASCWSTTALGGWFFPLLVWLLTLGFRSRSRESAPLMVEEKKHDLITINGLQESESWI